jgi:hypothetical protein
MPVTAGYKNNKIIKIKWNKNPGTSVLIINSMTVDSVIFFYTLVSFLGFVQANFKIEC